MAQRIRTIDPILDRISQLSGSNLPTTHDELKNAFIGQRGIPFGGIYKVNREDIAGYEASSMDNPNSLFEGQNYLVEAAPLYSADKLLVNSDGLLIDLDAYLASIGIGQKLLLQYNTVGEAYIESANGSTSEEIGAGYVNEQNETTHYILIEITDTSGVSLSFYGTYPTYITNVSLRPFMGTTFATPIAISGTGWSVTGDAVDNTGGSYSLYSVEDAINKTVGGGVAANTLVRVKFVWGGDVDNLVKLYASFNGGTEALVTQNFVDMNLVSGATADGLKIRLSEVNPSIPDGTNQALLSMNSVTYAILDTYGDVTSFLAPAMKNDVTGLVEISQFGIAQRFSGTLPATQQSSKFDYVENTFTNVTPTVKYNPYALSAGFSIKQNIGGDPDVVQLFNEFVVNGSPVEFLFARSSEGEIQIATTGNVLPFVTGKAFVKLATRHSNGWDTDTMIAWYLPNASNIVIETLLVVGTTPSDEVISEFTELIISIYP